MSAAACGLAGYAPAAAAPAVFFTDNLSQGQTLFTQTVASAAPDAVVFTYDLQNGSPSEFDVTAGDITVYVSSFLGANPASYMNNGFQQWSVSYNAADGFSAVVDAGYSLYFYEDAGRTTPFAINAVGLETWDWGTCCTGANTTPSGTASGSAIYMVFDPDSAASTNLIGNITSSISSTTHFVAAIDDRNSFSSVTLAPNGAGEAFGAGGYLMFSVVPIGSVPEDSSYVDVGEPPAPSIPDIDSGGPYTTTELNNGDVNPVFDGGELRLSSGGEVTADFTVNATNGAVNTNGFDAEFSGGLSGVGGLVKIGGGVLTLSGVNTFSGGLGIAEDGAVSVAADSALGGAGGPILFGGGTLITTDSFSTARGISVDADGGALDVAQETTLTHTGEIVGLGRLIKRGAGNLALGGENTFQGGVDILEGSLIVGADTALGAASADVVFDGGELATTASFATARATSIGAGDGAFNTAAETTLVHTGAISGVGALVKRGAGALVLAGDNTFAGGLEILNGAVVTSSDGALGAEGGAILLDNGALVAAQTFSTSRASTLGSNGGVIEVADEALLTHSGEMSGLGRLIKRGAGGLVLSGDNSFEGGVDILEGALMAASNSAFGGENGDIVIDGGVLAATASFSTARETGVGSQGGAIDVQDGAILTHSGVISGPGAFEKTGAGSLILDGVQSVAGVTVSGGSLYIHSPLSQAPYFDVLSGGSLYGRGTLIGDVTVFGGGVLSPGASPGTMTVAGDVTLSAGSSFIAEIDGYGLGTGAGNYDRLIVLGEDSVFTAAGSLTPLLRGISGDANNTFSPQIGDVFTIVTTEGSVTGAFDTLVQPSEGLAPNARFEILYGPDFVQLYVAPQLFSVTTGGGAARGNAHRAAQAMDTIRTLTGAGTTAGSTAMFQSLYGLESGAIAGAFEQIAGEIHADALAAALRGSRLVRSGHLFAAPGLQGGAPAGAGDCASVTAEDRSELTSQSCALADGRAWIDVSVSVLNAHSDNLAVGYDDERRAIYAGLNVVSKDDYRIDLIGGHTRGDVATHGVGDATIETTTVAVRGAARLGKFIVDASAGGTFADIETERLVTIPGVAAANASGDNAVIAHFDAAISYPAALQPGFSLTPYAGVQAEYVSAGGYAETGPAEFALSVARTDLATGRLHTGVMAQKSFSFFGKTSEVSARTAYAAEIESDSFKREVTLHGAGWEARSASIGDHVGEFAAGWRIDLTGSLKAGIEYQGQASERAYSHEASLSLAFHW